MTDDVSDFSEEVRTVEARLQAAADVRRKARQESEEAMQLVYGRLGRTPTFAKCEFALKGKSISVSRAGHVFAVITNVGGQVFDLSRPGAGKIAGDLSISGVGEAVAELVLADEANRATAS